MKKLFAILLTLAMVATFCACSAEVAETLVEEATEIVEEAIEVVEEAPVEETPVEEALVEEAPVEEAPAENGIRPEFKETMDAYEAFYDEYCAFMKKYMANPTDLSLLGEYSKMMQKVTDMDETFAQWESKDMSNEELSYYLEVTGRVSQKLLDVAS